MSKFYKPAHSRLYHCIPVRPEGDCIRPSDKYGMHIPEDIRQTLGMSKFGNAPLVFASPCITKALAFGLQGNLGEKILNSSIEGSQNEFVIACDRKAMLSRQRDVTVYEIPGRNFIPLPHADRQSVSTCAVPFAETGGYQAIEAGMREGGHRDIYGYLGDMLQKGKLVWENRVAGINPDAVLAAKTGFMPQASVAQKTKGPAR